MLFMSPFLHFQPVLCKMQQTLTIYINFHLTTFAGLNLTLLDLGYNSLRRVPSAALAKTRSIGSLILDGNMFERLETGTISGINVVNLSVKFREFIISLKHKRKVNIFKNKTKCWAIYFCFNIFVGKTDIDRLHNSFIVGHKNSIPKIENPKLPIFCVYFTLVSNIVNPMSSINIYKMMMVETYLFYPQICGCNILTVIEMNSFVNLPVTEIIKISHNPSLVYMHPGNV